MLEHEDLPPRRSHYRNRRDINAKRRGQYASIKGTDQTRSGVETVTIPVQLPAVALIYLYREARKDAHLHALVVAVWQGEKKLAEVEPIHCIGMTNTQVNQYLRQVLKMLGDRFGIREYEPAVRLEPMECPIRPCPLKGH